ncbi:MAG: acetyl-CoA hydrolase/transferase family protein, partial [Solirubrobacterales bacterium]|nr:acetyl-CoA hydrolase/transferase family protein [Solirubrobacterales bacterium]
MHSATEAAELVRPTDTLGLPLGPGQPPTFLGALGERDDWEDLRVYGALLGVGTELFARDNVHMLSGFFGPFERALRDAGSGISFAPADFRRFAPLYERQSPRVMCTVASRPDADGWCSLSLHAGGSIAELKRAGADPERLLVVEAASGYPRTSGLPPEYPHRIHADEADVLIASDASPLELPAQEPTDADRSIADNAAAFIGSGSTVQTGIGAVPSTIAAILAEGDYSDLGIHSEMFTDGLMQLHLAGAVSNRKGVFDGRSIATFAFGSDRLYEWLDGNEEVAFLPVDVVNSPETIRRNRRMVSINAALAIDIHGQVVADTIHGRQYSGIGGSEDFAAGSGFEVEDRSLICLPATVEIDGELRSRIVPAFERGAVITTPRHQVDVIVTEFGAAELEGKTVHQRGLELARIAHPDFRDELVEAA